jgi:hypothetical protein
VCDLRKVFTCAPSAMRRIRIARRSFDIASTPTPLAEVQCSKCAVFVVPCRTLGMNTGHHAIAGEDASDMLSERVF